MDVLAKRRSCRFTWTGWKAACIGACSVHRRALSRGHPKAEAVSGLWRPCTGRLIERGLGSLLPRRPRFGRDAPIPLFGGHLCLRVQRARDWKPVYRDLDRHSRRVLVLGDKLRIATSDLAFLTGLYGPSILGTQQ